MRVRLKRVISDCRSGVLEQLLHDRPEGQRGTVAVARGRCLQQFGSGEPYLPVFEALEQLSQTLGRRLVEAKQRGYTTTIFGRRRQITELASDNFRIRQMGERMAQNAPVQGSAADIFKLAMIDVDRVIEEHGFRTRMLLTVHDELVFEVPEVELAWAKEAVPRIMAGVATLAVPLVAEVGVGANWDEAH